MLIDPLPGSMIGLRWIEANRLRFQSAATRLSTGLRVNTAGDDAAGLFIAQKMRVQSQGWHVAQRNIQDGLSIANVAEGALNVIGDLVHRIRELAVQASSEMFGAQERSAIQGEIDVLNQEIVNVVESTWFNGIQVLVGDRDRPDPTVSYSVAPPFTGGVGAPAGGFGTESGNYPVIVTAAPKRAFVRGDTNVTNLTATVSITVTGRLGTATYTIDNTVDPTPADWLDYMENVSATPLSSLGLEALITDNTTTDDDGNLLDPGNFGYLLFRSLEYGSNAIVGVTTAGTDVNDHTGFGPAPSPPTPATGSDVQVSVNGAAATSSATGAGVVVTVDDPGNGADDITFTLDNTIGYTLGQNLGNIDVAAFPITIVDLEIDIQSGPNSPDHQLLTFKPMLVDAFERASTTTTLQGIDVSFAAGAQAALDVANAALLQVNEARSAIASQAKALEQGASFALREGEDQAAGESRIRDADVAAESAELIQAQIQGDAANAALAHHHANSVMALKLITESQVETQVTELAAPSQGETPATGTLTSGEGFVPSSVMSGSFTPQGVGGGTFTEAPILTGSFSPTPVTPGFQPLPVIGSGGGSGGAAVLSAGDMMSMVAGSLA